MPRIHVIGAGVSGLCAGSYLQMNGFETHVFEAHQLPGGLCTAWQRQGYTFDGCVHWLLGSRPGNPFYDLWSELLDMSSIPFVDHDLRFDLTLPDLRDRHGSDTFHLWGNVERLERYLLDLAPEDEKPIGELIRHVRALQRHGLPPMDCAAPLRNWRDKLAMLRFLPLVLEIRKWSKRTNADFARRFSNPFLRAAMGLLFEEETLPMVAITMQLANYDRRCAGYPVGGSLPFAKKLEERYRALGGQIHYRSPVARIRVAGGKAVGVELKDGTVHDADGVVSAADGRFTLYEALRGKYTDAHLDALYRQERLKVFPSVVLVSLGVARTFEGQAHLQRLPLAKPIESPDGTTYRRLEAHLFNYDPTLAPAGKTVVTVTLSTKNADWWTDARERDREAYRAAKEALADQVIAALEARFGDFASKVEVRDVATPATVARYTGNWKGSIQGWFPSADFLTAKPLPRELPGLENFYMVGQWVEPGGGLPTAIKTARDAAQIICHRAGRRFEVKRPAPREPAPAAAISDRR